MLDKENYTADLLNHSPDGYKSQLWVRMKSGVISFIWVAHMDGRDAST